MLTWWANRKDKDYTYLYGKTPAEGSLTPWIHEAFHKNIEECVLDINDQVSPLTAS